MNIRCNQWYRMRDGARAFVALKNLNDQWCLIGLVDGSYYVYTWREDGTYNPNRKRTHEHDLIAECGPPEGYSP